MQSAITKSEAYLENIRVTSKTGKVYDLGSPKSLLFPVRVAIYKLRRKFND